jgi:hypothetical protein
VKRMTSAKNVGTPAVSWRLWVPNDRRLMTPPLRAE